MGVTPDIFVTGDAGIVLSRFLASLLTLVGAALVVAVEVRGTRGVAEGAGGLALLVVVLRTSFVALVADFFSAVDELPIVVRRAVLVPAFGSVSLEAVDGRMDALLAAPETLGLLFSAVGLVGPFLTSSIELTEALGLCPGAATAVPVRRMVEDTGGRVGGLLSVLPGVVRFAVTLAAVEGVGAVGRLAVVRGRLGGTVAFRGEVTGVLLSSVGAAPAGLSSSESTSGTGSSIALVSAGSSASTEAIVVWPENIERGQDQGLIKAQKSMIALKGSLACALGGAC